MGQWDGAKTVSCKGITALPIRPLDKGLLCNLHFLLCYFALSISTDGV